jgi:two-component system sensor histidine kinase HydH
MSAAVAHSIRNPLASIRSAAELAREEEPTKVGECLDDIIHEADRLNRWVSDLLMAARGNVEFAEIVDLNEVVHESLTGRAQESSRRNISVNFDKEPLPFITGGCALLSHAILNVIANAQEAIGRGGSLNIQSRLLGDGRIRISIEDSGGGVPADIAHRIIRPMFTTKPNGVGLGLALTKRIVERHSGEIVIRSRSNRGAGVELTLPVRG